PAARRGRVAHAVVGRRNGGREEVMLDRREPTALLRLRDRGLAEIVELELLVFVAVEQHGPGERIRLDRGVASLDGVIETRHLHVWRAAPRRIRARLQLEVDRIRAAMERVDLLRLEGAVLGPVQSHDERVLAGHELVARARGAKGRDVVWLGGTVGAGAAQARLKYPARVGLVVEEPHEMRRVPFVDG